MANWLEKRLPAVVRDRTSSLLGAALGLFLGLQYNDFIKACMLKIFPTASNLLLQGGMLLVMTAIIILLQILIAKALDGK